MRPWPEGRLRLRRGVDLAMVRAVTLLRAANLGLAFGSRTLFADLELVVEENERVGLIGVNGSGKSTLMKILAGAMRPDTGELQRQRGASVTYLAQEPQFAEGATIASELTVANGKLRDALASHAELSARLSVAAPAAQDKLLGQLAGIAHDVETLGGWDTAHEARRLLQQLGVEGWDRPIAQLSGGLRKRVALARALLSRPDLLLLDEPTNHLDADTVDWLEEEIDRSKGALLLVTHDRYFLDDLVDRIVEIEPGKGVVSYPGNYEAYLAQKIAAQADQARAQHKRDRWISQEVAWLRRGVEARRTKSKARIDRARKLMAEQGLASPKVAELRLASTRRLSATVLEAEEVVKSFDGTKVLAGVSLILQKGERIGIVGKNGAGKTTLLRVLLGELAPDSGKVVVGKGTRVAYYDQDRAQLDPEETVYEAASGEDFVDLGGKRVALRDYLEDLLFPVPMQRMQVKALSGGERNRLLLARLFLQGANVLVLDEPTNDLDLVTLNVLEGLLLDFTGAVLLVTHDRYFLDKVATAILAFEGDGKVTRYPGNFESYRTLKEQFARQRQSASAPASASAQAQGQAQAQEGKTGGLRSPAGTAPRSAVRKPGRLSFKEQRELSGIEQAIEEAEVRKAAAEAALADPATYARDAAGVPALKTELDAAGLAVEQLYARWQELQDLL
jgi:ABC transport system ATP-binding/permease protein